MRSNKLIDLAGTVFGVLTVLSRNQNNTLHGKARWNCKCSCGNNLVISGNNLRTGNSLSCGCKAIENKVKSTVLRLTGKQFGFLTLIKAYPEIRSPYGHVEWEVSCICGKIFRSFIHKVVSGHTKSCGCKSTHLKSISNGGTGIPYETQKLLSLLRHQFKYSNWRKTLLKERGNICEISGNLLESQFLHIHHIIPLNVLITKYSINKNNYNQFDCILYDNSNIIIMSNIIHKQFHSLYGNNTNSEQLKEFKDNYGKSS